MQTIRPFLLFFFLACLRAWGLGSCQEAAGLASRFKSPVDIIAIELIQILRDAESRDRTVILTVGERNLKLAGFPATLVEDNRVIKFVFYEQGAKVPERRMNGIVRIAILPKPSVLISFGGVAFGLEDLRPNGIAIEKGDAEPYNNLYHVKTMEFLTEAKAEAWPVTFHFPGEKEPRLATVYDITEDAEHKRFEMFVAGGHSLAFRVDKQGGRAIVEWDQWKFNYVPLMDVRLVKKSGDQIALKNAQWAKLAMRTSHEQNQFFRYSFGGGERHTGRVTSFRDSPFLATIQNDDQNVFTLVMGEDGRLYLCRENHERILINNFEVRQFL